MSERIFVADGIRIAERPDGGNIAANMRDRKLRAVRAYLYSGWEYSGWGSAPADSGPMVGMTGFYFTRVDDASGSGFGTEVQLDRLASGLHFGIPVNERGDAAS